MASQTWTKTTSGTVQDTQGNNVGTGDGAGTITITANVEVGPATDTLTISEGVTVKFDAGFRFNVRCTAASGTFGTLDINGTSSEGVTLTSNAGTPAAGDWNGVLYFGGSTSFKTVAPVVNMQYCTVEYYTSISSQSAAGFVPNSFTAMNCNFYRYSSVAVSNQAGQGTTFPWNLTYCCFSQCQADGADNALQCISGGLPTGSDRAQMLIDHCSFNVDYNNNLADHFIIQVGNRSDATLKNSCIVSTNAGTREANIANLGTTDPQLTNNNNFYLTADAGGSEEYVADSSDQNVDPSYQDDTCSAPDLSPDAQVGSPDLYLAADDGIFVGAKMPYNYPTGS